MKKSMYILIVIVLICLGWTIFSYVFENSIDSPEYSVVQKNNGYEIRSYKPYITAQVKISGSYDEALNQGFRILADYIFGNNTKQKNIDMTAPVTESLENNEKMDMTAPVLIKENEKLDMTAPVIESGDNQLRTISFVMPFKYTLETLPKPNNSKIDIVAQEARKVAVLRFSWFRNSKRVAKKKQELLDLLERDGISVKGFLEYAGYNSPFSAPWLNRNEIMVEVGDEVIK